MKRKVKKMFNGQISLRKFCLQIMINRSFCNWFNIIEAKKSKNELRVEANIAMNDTNTRKYPDLEFKDKSKCLVQKINLKKTERATRAKNLVPFMILKLFRDKTIIILMGVVMCGTNLQV